MWLKRLQVKNFRSLQTMDLPFVRGFNAIVGENGTGKSNIVRAILKILGPSYPGGNSFQTEDYTNFDETKEIDITLTFDMGGVEAELRWGEDSRGKRRLILNDDLYVTGEGREAFAPIYFPSNREVHELPGINRWNPIGRIIHDLAKLMESDPALMEQYKVKGAELNALLESSPPYTEFRTSFLAHSEEHLGDRADGLGLRLSLIDPENILRTLQLFETIDGHYSNVSNSGEGIQSSVTMAAIRAFAKVGKGSRFILADEPESFLHPLAQRALASCFSSLADQGVQTIVSTHSPYFIPAHDPRGVHKVHLKDRLSAQITYDPAAHLEMKRARGAEQPTVEGLLARLTRELTTDVREGLFAKVAVLCEGDSEALALPEWARSMGFDMATAGIAVVPSGGKFSMADLAEFYECFGLPTYLVFDSDPGKMGADRGKHALHNRLLCRIAGREEEDFPATLVGPRSASLSPDYERVMRAEDSEYQTIESVVNEERGLDPAGAKPVRACYVAKEYVRTSRPAPPTVKALLTAVRTLREAISASTTDGSSAGEARPSSS